MRVNLRIILKGLSISALLLAFHACSGPSATDPGKKDDPIDKGGDGKPKKGLFGVLVDKSGSPLKGASVKAIPDSTQALAKSAGTRAAAGAAVSDSAVTDSAGMFVFLGLAKGGYNLLGEYGPGKLVVLITGVKYAGDDALAEIKTDTLRSPGKLAGKVSFSEGESGGVTCALAGTLFSVVTGDSGTYSFSGLPQGQYTLVYRKDGVKPSQVSGITVKSGDSAKVTVLELVADPAFPPPAPAAPEIAYDTLTGKASLHWRKVKVDDLAGYVLYRNPPGAAEATRLGTALIKDTAYVDVVFTNLLDSADKEYVYRLKAQDASGALSAAFSKPTPLKAPSQAKVRTRFAWKTAGTLGDSASIGDSVTVTSTFTNPSRKIIKLAFYLDNKKTAAASTVESAPTGSESIKVSSSKAESRVVFAEATDEAGGAWWDSVSVRFVTDAPVAEAGKDTTAPIHSKISFAGSATQTFGTIVKYKWDFDGDGVYEDSSATGTATHTYDHGSVYTAVLLVRDDDGNERIDFRTITIDNQAPKVKSVRADTTVSLNDPIVFTGTGSDTDGTLKGFGWDFDANGTVDSSSAVPFTPVYRYAKAGVYNPVFRVTDDDGLIAERSVKITVLKDAPVASAGKDTTVSIKDTVRLKGTATDGYGTIAVWAWDLGATGTFKIVSKGDTNITATSVPTAAWPCVLRVTDDDGNVAFDTVVINVLKDAPTANAGADTTVSIGDAVNLRGRGTDVYGSIAERAWDVGATGTFRVAATGDTTILASSVPGAFTCILRVTDDDGNIVKDTMAVTIVKDAPVVSAGKDTTIAVGQALTLTGSATQNYGTIAMYKWDWQDNGSWDDSSTTISTTIFSVNQGGTRTVLFYVRDDDGNVVVDTVLVNAVSYVGGTLSGTNTFIKALSPYVLTADLQVPAGADLVLSAGVKLSGPFAILIKGGSLTSIGIAADSVLISSPVRFEGTNLSGSQIGYARLSAATALQIGNNSLGSGPTQNSGTLLVQDASFPRNSVVAEAMSGSSKLQLRRVRLDSATLVGSGTGVLIDIFSPTLYKATIQSNITNNGIMLDSGTVDGSTFLVGGDGATLTLKNSSLTASSVKEGTGTVPAGLTSFTGCQLTNTTVELPKSAVNFTSTVASFSGATPLLKIGSGALFKAKFTGAGEGTGLEITGYSGNSISGASTIDSSTTKDFNIGLLVRGFGSLSISNTNFVNNISYDLQNLSASAFNALGCYWSGANSLVNINTRIRDGSDDVTLGVVTFSPWVAATIDF